MTSLSGLMVYLTGFMGSGKSTVGRELAHRLNRPFIDLDERIECREGCSISRLFTDSGETAFRDAEHRALAALPRERHPVVATGGGIVLRPENLRFMDRSGRRIWLKCPLEEIARRLENSAGGGDLRPLWTGDLAELGRLLAQRTPSYASAELTVDAVGTVDRTVEEIVRWLEGRTA